MFCDWWKENYDGEKQPIIVDEKETEITHSVLIFGVKNSTIQVGGKINAVSMSSYPLENVNWWQDNCEGTGLVLDTLVGGLEISKSKKIQLQILGKTPMINIDHVDQATVYLSKTTLDVEIITTSTTGVNVYPLTMTLTVATNSQCEGGGGLLWTTRSWKYETCHF